MKNKKKKTFKSLVKNIAGPYLGLPKEVYIIFIAQVVNSLGALVFPFLTLILKRKIGIGPASISRILFFSAIVFGISSIIGGRISDMVGRKKTIIYFELAGLIGYVICIFSGTGIFLVIMIMVSSFCFGLAGPSHSAMIADLTKGKKRDGAYSLTYFGFNLGFVAAQILGGFLFENNFRLLFLIDAATVFVAVLLIIFFINETHPEKTADKSRRPEGPDPAKNVNILKILFRNPVLPLFALASLLYRLVYGQWSFLIPLHAERNFQEAAGTLWGTMGALNASIVVGFTLILTRVFNKLTNIHRIIIAGVFFVFGFGLLGFIDVKAAFFISICIFTIGEIIEAISLMPFIMNHTPPTHRGRMGAVLNVLFTFGFAGGPLITGPIAEDHSFESAWHVVLIIAVIGLVLMSGVAFLDKKYAEKGVPSPAEE